MERVSKCTIDLGSFMIFSDWKKKDKKKRF